MKTKKDSFDKLWDDKQKMQKNVPIVIVRLVFMNLKRKIKNYVRIVIDMYLKVIEKNLSID